MSTLRIYLLGGLRVYYGEDPLPPFPTQKTRSLFAYLVTYDRQTHTRTHLASTFWPGKPSDRARRNLNTTLWRLRRTLPPGYLQADGERIFFDPSGDCWVDVASFEQALQQAGLSGDGAATLAGPYQNRLECLQQAAELYRGDFLAGFYEDWSLVEAERLRALYLQVLSGLLSFHRVAGEYELALELALKLLEADPLHEETHQQAMELYALLGQREQALAQFETCRHLLQQELGVDPMPETRTLYGRIQASNWQRLPPDLPTERARPRRYTAHGLPRNPFDDFGQVPLVGREEVWSALLNDIALVARGNRALVMVLGRAGEGKTRLIRELVLHAEAKGWVRLWGNCPQLKEPLPYQVWVEALRSALSWLRPQDLANIPRSWLGEITLLLPELDRLLSHLPPPAAIPPKQRQEQLRQALRQFLVGLGQIRPCLVVLEDLHWADEATLDALQEFTQVQDIPLMILATARSEEISPVLRAALENMSKGDGFRCYDLGPLSRAELGDLTGALLGWSTPETLFVERLHRETGGNPFYAIEVLKGLYEQGWLQRGRDGQWKLMQEESSVGQDDWPLPHGIRQVVRRRFEPLSQRGCDLLELAAVLGKEMDLDLLGKSSGWPEETVLEVTDELLRRQFLVEEDDDLGFAHDYIRQAIYQDIPPARRESLHRQAGVVLEVVYPERVEELSQHFFLGRQLERALPYCLQAGERSFFVYAASAVLTYYGWAIEAASQLPGVDVRRTLIEAYERRGLMYDLLGDYQAARREFDEMATVATAVGDGSALARSVRLTGWVIGERHDDWQNGIREAQRAYELAKAIDDRHEMAAAMRDVGMYHNLLGNTAASLRAHRAALAFFCQAGDEVEAASILHYMAVAHMFLSQNEEALDLFEQVLVFRERLGDRRAVAKTLSNMGFLQINRGEFAEAEGLLRRAVSELQDIGSVGAVPFAQMGLGSVLRYRGACRESLEVLEQAIDLDTRLGQRGFNRSLMLYHRAYARWDLGMLGPAWSDMQESLDLSRQCETPTLEVGVLNALGSFLSSLGRVVQSRERHQESLDLSRGIGFPAGEVDSIIGLGLTRVARGDVVGGRACLAQAVSMARGLGLRWQGQSLVALAEACLYDWDLEPARALSRRASELAERMDLRPLQVQSLGIWGQALAGLGRLTDAESVLRRALDLSAATGYPMERWSILLALSSLLAEMGRASESARVCDQAREVVEMLHSHLEDGEMWRGFESQPAVWSLFRESVERSPPDDLVIVSLARLGVPMGRPLRREERVAVLWTAQFDPILGENKVARRRRHLLRLLTEARLQQGDPTEADLAQVLGVSPRTVRSDVAVLRQSGRCIRTRGARI
jgi:DNA-binding SARP family transcriptional activator